MTADGSRLFHSNNWFNLNEIEGYVMSGTAVVLMKSHYCKCFWPL